MWGWLPAEHRRWIVSNALAATAVVNTVVNGVVAWLSMRDQDAIPLWPTELVGQTSVLTDTLGTLFLLPLITCLLTTTVVWQRMRSGELARVEGLGARLPVLATLPPGRLIRGVVLGAWCLGLFALPTLALCAGLPLDDLSRSAFVVVKVVFAVALGALVTPLIAVRAMADRL